jgi:hypothetical protein
MQIWTRAIAMREMCLDSKYIFQIEAKIGCLVNLVRNRGVNDQSNAYVSVYVCAYPNK